MTVTSDQTLRERKYHITPDKDNIFAVADIQLIVGEKVSENPLEPNEYFIDIKTKHEGEFKDLVEMFKNNNMDVFTSKMEQLPRQSNNNDFCLRFNIKRQYSSMDRQNVCLKYILSNLASTKTISNADFETIDQLERKLEQYSSEDITKGTRIR